MTLATTSSPTRFATSDRRPVAFLVTTTSCARDIRAHLGSAAYSYHFVAEALAPVLERLGTWRAVDHPESRLAFAAARAEAEGFQPVHLAINPLQDVYLSPRVPNIVFPFWEFPDVPSRNFGFDTRQNWVRTCRGAALVLSACEFTAQAFRRAGVQCPVAVVPIPLDPDAFTLPTWDPRHSWTLTCRHEVLGPQNGAPLAVAGNAAPPREEIRATGFRAQTWRLLRQGFRRVEPWFDPMTAARLVKWRHRLGALRIRPGRLSWKSAFAAVRGAYRRYVRRWLSQEALERIHGLKVKALGLFGREPTAVPDPPLDSGTLTIGGGLVYLTMFNVGDFRKNYRDMLTAFLSAFRDRPDVTLVIKLVTNPVRERHEFGVLKRAYEALGMAHRCRVVVIVEFLTDSQMNELFRVTSYYVNTSHAEGACLPLMRALAGGRPAIAPNHTAMGDYVDEQVAFVPRAHPEPAYWPHDPEQKLETSRHRLVWSDLRDAFLASAEVAEHRPVRYAAMAATARTRMASYAARDTAEAALRDALDRMDRAIRDSPAWRVRLRYRRRFSSGGITTVGEPSLPAAEGSRRFADILNVVIIKRCDASRGHAHRGVLAED